MKILIDTHIWAFMANRPNRLGKRTAQILANRRNEIWLSPLTLWEVILLQRIGRFRGTGAPEDWFVRTAKDWSIQEAPLTNAIAVEAGMLSLPTKDPADCLLIATARVLGCKFVTEDIAIIASGLVDTLPND